MTAIRSPFVFQRSLKSTDNVARCDSDDDVTQVVEGLLNGAYFSIMGPACSGKTTFLFSVLARAHSVEMRCLPAYIDFANTRTETKADVCRILIQAVGQAVPDARQWTCNEITELYPKFHELLQRHPLRLILAFDHLEELPLNHQVAIVQFARSLYNERNADPTMTRISLMLAGTLDLYGLPSGPGSPNNISELIWMRDLTPRQTRALVARGARLANAHFTRAAVDRLINETNGDRYFIQRICHACLSTASSRLRRIGVAEVAIAVEDVASSAYYQDRCFGKVLRILYGADLEILQALHSLVGDDQHPWPLSGATMEKARLTGLFRIEGSSYKIRNDIYRRYIMRHRQLIRRGIDLVHREEKSSRRLLELQRVALALASTLDSPAAFQRALADLRRVLSAQCVVVFTLDRTRNRYSVTACDPEQEWLRSVPLGGRTRVPQILARAGHLFCQDGPDSCYVGSCPFIGHLPSCSCAWLPMRRSGSLSGMLAIVNSSPVIFSTNETQALALVASQLAAALTHSQLVALFGKVQALELDTSPIETIWRRIVLDTCNLLNVPAVNLWLLDTDTSEFRVVASEGTPPSVYHKYRLRLEDPQTAAFVSAGKPLYLRNIHEAPGFHESDKVHYSVMGLNSLFSVPLRTAVRTLGIIEAATYAPWGPTVLERDMFHLWASQVAAALDRANDWATLRETGQEREEYIEVFTHQLPSGPIYAQQVIENLLDAKLGPLNDDQRNRLMKAAERLRGLTDMIGRLQLLGRLNAGKMTPQRKPTQINEIVSGVIRVQAEAAEAAGVALNVHYAPRLPTVNVDDTQIGIVLANLVGNAIRYTPTGGEVTVRSRLRGNVIRVSVDDTGVGVPAEEAHRIFDRHYQSKRTAFPLGMTTDRGGIGLGLYLARRFAQMHGGDVTLAPKRGAGAHFLLMLPLSPKVA